MTHLDCLRLRLSNERVRLADAKTADDQALRAAWVYQCEREIVGELEFLGMAQDAPPSIDEDELLAALLA